MKTIDSKNIITKLEIESWKLVYILSVANIYISQYLENADREYSKQLYKDCLSLINLIIKFEEDCGQQTTWIYNKEFKL